MVPPAVICRLLGTPPDNAPICAPPKVPAFKLRLPPTVICRLCKAIEPVLEVMPAPARVPDIDVLPPSSHTSPRMLRVWLLPITDA
jgi:hypothetical protein